MLTCNSPISKPDLDFFFKGLDEGGATHGLRLDNLVVQDGLDVVHRRQDGDAGVAVGDEAEGDVLPFIHHLLHCLLQGEFLWTQKQRDSEQWYLFSTCGKGLLRIKH